MRFSPRLTAALAAHVLKNFLLGVRRYPLVLMLEPLFRCNLHCPGCGRVREFHDDLDRTLTAAECLDAAAEAGAPVVSITGGEPLLHPDIETIAAALLRQRRFVYLCTNGLLMERSLSRFRPDPRFYFVLHLDGLAETHDRLTGRGVFDAALAGIRSARKQGFQVLVNTTFHRQSHVEEVRQLFSLLAGIPVNGIMVSPAFGYEALGPGAVLSRAEVHRFFQALYAMRRTVPFYNTSLYLEFLAGNLELECRPWSTPTRNPRGWKVPCYLLTDGHVPTFRQLMDETEWSRYGSGRDARCAHCMVHSGFEGGALSATARNPSYLWRMVRGA